jgi:3-deoxy-D-manno-octulosonate 8-phosphate phosphatase (KDO 8-P phosphatase)
MAVLLQYNMKNLQERLANIKYVLTDCDGVLTDGGVYYGDQGEYLKKFNIRDGMGVERLP